MAPIDECRARVRCFLGWKLLGYFKTFVIFSSGKSVLFGWLSTFFDYFLWDFVKGVVASEMCFSGGKKNPEFQSKFTNSRTFVGSHSEEK